MLDRQRTQVAFLVAATAMFACAAQAPTAAQSARLEIAGGQTTFVPSEEIVVRYRGIATSPMDYLELGSQDGERLESRLLGRQGESVEGAWRLDLPEGRYVVRWISPDNPGRAWESALRAEATFEVVPEGTEVEAPETAAEAVEEPEAAGEAPVAEAAPEEPVETADEDAVADEEVAPADPEADEAEVAEAPEAAPAGDRDLFVSGRDDWTTYRNARFGTTIAFPDEVFRPLAAPQNGAGRQFENAADGARLEIYAWNNVDGETPQSLRRRLSDTEGHGRVTYRPAGRNWLVLSGFREGKVFYEKFLFDDRTRTVHGFAIEFPRNRRGVYDPLLERIEDSFRIEAPRAL